MASRTSSKNRCERCRMNSHLCLCAQIPSLTLATKVVVLMHYRELTLPTNTATLACLALTNSEIHLRGQLANPLNLEALSLNSSNLALLFPSDDAVELNAETVHHLPRPLTLLVPDGSWRQAKKMAWREEILASALHVKLPRGLPSTYRLRRSPLVENLSTFEAIARALGILEGQAVQSTLEAIFQIKVERTLWSRGGLSSKDCTTPIPCEAIAAQRLAGAAGSPMKHKVPPN